MSEIGLLVGKGAEHTIITLARKLKSATKENWNLANKKERACYFPAMCLLPLADIIVPTEIYRKSKLKTDNVVTDEDYLRGLWKLFTTNREHFLDSLIGDDADWKFGEEKLADGKTNTYCINSALNRMKEVSSFYNTISTELIDEIIPLKQRRARGLSLDIYRGTLFLGVPDKYPEILMMMDIAHELGHQALTILNSADQLLVSDYNTPVYSEIRHADRPAIQSLHAAAAIAFMLKLVSDMGSPHQMHPDCPEILSISLSKAIKHLKKKCRFTETGEILVNELNIFAERHSISDRNSVTLAL